MKKILFITPYFGRTGSEMQLFYILNQLDRTKYSPYLFTGQRGSLLEELSHDIPYTVSYKGNYRFLWRIFIRFLKILNVKLVEFQLRKIHKKFKPDFWYINTIVNEEAFKLAKELNVKVISHIHELPMSYDLVNYSSIKDIAEYSSMFIGCSKIVCESLENMGCRNVHLLYGFINQSDIKFTRDNKEIAVELGIMASDFVWVISGTVSTTKGVDFLIPLLRHLKKNHKIIWLGNKNLSGTYYYVEQTINSQFAGRVIFTGAKVEDYYSYFSLGHACLSLSRVDSFGLVLLEAQHLGKPIVGFNSGGIKELVIKDTGIVVDQLNFKELAEAMANVEENLDSYDSAYIASNAKKFNLEQQTKILNTLLDSVN